MTTSIPLEGLSNPNVSKTRRPVKPNRLLLTSRSSARMSGMPCGMTRILSCGTA